jgi:hypothetical protein
MLQRGRQDACYTVEMRKPERRRLENLGGKGSKIFK